MTEINKDLGDQKDLQENAPEGAPIEAEVSETDSNSLEKALKELKEENDRLREIEVKFNNSAAKAAADSEVLNAALRKREEELMRFIRPDVERKYTPEADTPISRPDFAESFKAPKSSEELDLSL